VFKKQKKLKSSQPEFPECTLRLYHQYKPFSSASNIIGFVRSVASKFHKFSWCQNSQDKHLKREIKPFSGYDCLALMHVSQWYLNHVCVLIMETNHSTHGGHEAEAKAQV
jgi:hypothetical protein